MNSDAKYWKADIQRIVPKIATRISFMNNGDQAMLRRNPLKGAGINAFWQLAVDYNIGENDTECFGRLVQAIAILSPRMANASESDGEEATANSAHNKSISMGKALARANVSSIRLTQLLRASWDIRCKLLLTLCRRLKNAGETRFDLTTLAQLMIWPECQAAQHQLMREYHLEEQKQSKIKEEDGNDR